MKGSRLLGSALSLLIAAAATLLPDSISATNEREFAWTAMVFDDATYQGVFLPSEKPTIYILAGEKHVLVAHYTMVYYWAIDREYKPDWERMDDLVDGTIEVRDARDAVIGEIRQQQYLLTNPGHTVGDLTELHLGNDADAVYDLYVKDRDAYLASVNEYDRQMAEYARKYALDPTDPTIRPPSPPPAFNELMSPPRAGFVLDLPRGTYHIRLRDQGGDAVEGSDRTVYSVVARRESTGYIVIPEAKWTISESSDEPGQIIYYASDGAALYLVPVATKEYNEKEYVRINTPQDTLASANRWIWLHGQPITRGLRLQVWSDHRLVKRVDKEGYSVQQSSGSALGYQIVPAEDTGSAYADFEAFKVPAAGMGTRFVVRLERDDGTIVPGSERTHLRVRKDIPTPGFLIALLPLAVALGISYRRRKLRSRSLKELATLGA